jgi:hypothetical protein
VSPEEEESRLAFGFSSLEKPPSLLVLRSVSSLAEKDFTDTGIKGFWAPSSPVPHRGHNGGNGTVDESL